MLPRLDEFLLLPTLVPRSSYVREPGFKHLYVRNTKRLWKSRLVLCVDLANIAAKPTGQGTFTRLVTRLHSQYNLCVECVSTGRFEKRLRRMGFKQLPNLGGYPSYFLSKRMKLRDV